MSEAVNGQIVPALGQWHGVIVIVTALAVALLASMLSKAQQINLTLTDTRTRPAPPRGCGHKTR